MLNWDWWDIARTETSSLSSERFLAEQTTQPKQLVQWRTFPDCCRYCLRWHGHMFTVVDPNPPHKDADTQVWVGKIANYGGPYRRLT